MFEVEINRNDIKLLFEKYFLQELRKGEHPDDVELDFLDIADEIIDERTNRYKRWLLHRSDLSEIYVAGPVHFYQI